MTTKTLVGGNKKASNMTENEQRRFGIIKNLINFMVRESTRLSWLILPKMKLKF